MSKRFVAISAVVLAAASLAVSAASASPSKHGKPAAGRLLIGINDEAYTLYGYLSSAAVARGQHVEAGESLGLSGEPPAGAPTVYFELRIDGQPVDPVQWLKPR